MCIRDSSTSRPSAAASGSSVSRGRVLTCDGERAIASGCLIGTYARPDGSQKVDVPQGAVTIERGSAV